MLQATMVEPGKIEFNEVEIPDIKEDEVLIEMKRIGVCGSDIHVYYGEHPYTSYPVVQGHEVSGRIVKVGSKVKDFKKDDKVVVRPQVVCGECYPCRHGDYNICDNLKVMGFQTGGLAKEYAAVEQSKVLKIPNEISYDKGALVEPLAVAAHAVSKADMDLDGKNVIVLGAGTIGNLVGQVAKAKGANVLITDLSDYRLEKAKNCGIDYTVNTKEKSLNKAISEYYGADKADLILECVGAEATINQAINNARKGSKIVVVGVFPKKANVDFGLVQDRELTLDGTLMYKEKDYIEAIELISKDRICADEMITDHFKFKEYKKAYEYIEEQGDKVMKVMINVDEV